MKNFTKQLDTNFTYAILAVITVGFFLWHSIAIFNLEQDLKTLQNSTPSLRGGTTTQSQDNNTQNPQNVMPTTEESQDTHILYNEDGSIDTSNWQEYCNKEYGFCVKYPQGWEVGEYLLTPFSGDGLDCSVLPTPKECDTFSVRFGVADDAIMFQLLKNKKEGIARMLDNAVNVQCKNVVCTVVSYNAMSGSCNSRIIFEVDDNTDIMLSSSYSSTEDIKKALKHNFDPAGNDALDKFCIKNANMTIFNMIIDSFAIL